MLATCATAVLLGGGAVVAGQAILVACGRPGWSWLSAPVGLAALLVIAGIAARLPGHAATAAAALAATTGAGLVYLRGRVGLGAAALAPGLAAGMLAGLAASIPFLVNGRVGVLGAGLVNDDMASHLVMADWVQNRSGLEPGLVADGYPLGPHSLVAALAEALGAGPIEVFAGLTIAIAAITAWAAWGALHELPPRRAAAAALLTAVCYLAASYLAQGSFKEPLLAALVIAFAVELQRGRGRGSTLAAGVPLAVLAAGAIHSYSFPALFWLGGTALAWIALLAVRGRLRPHARGRRLRELVGPVALATGLLAIAILPEITRIMRFAGFQAFDPGTDGLGNLAHPLSPLEALGVWPTADFRVGAADATVPALGFYLGAALGALALALGIARAWREGRLGLIAALSTAAAIYAGSAATVSAYASAKALAVVAPLAMLLALRGVLARPAREPVRDRAGHGLSPGLIAALGVTFAVAAGASSFLALRGGVVGPADHMRELAELRPLVQGEKVLFLGRDNFVLYELRGSRPFTHVRNYYDPYFVEPNFELRDAGSKFGFDAIPARTLARFPYVITTRAAYASGPPPRYRAARSTGSYVLWERRGDPSQRRAVEQGAAPGARLKCRADRAGAQVATWPAEPVVGAGAAWSPGTRVESGTAATQELHLPRGHWQLSLHYDATQPVTVSAGGVKATIPANLDYRGVGPFWPAGSVRVERPGTVRVSVSVASPPLLGRLLGADSIAHLGAIVATPAGSGYVRDAPVPAPGAPGRLRPAGASCGDYADWIEPKEKG